MTGGRHPASMYVHTVTGGRHPSQRPISDSKPAQMMHVSAPRPNIFSDGDVVACVHSVVAPPVSREPPAVSAPRRHLDRLFVHATAAKSQAAMACRVSATVPYPRCALSAMPCSLLPAVAAACRLSFAPLSNIPRPTVECRFPINPPRVPSILGFRPGALPGQRSHMPPLLPPSSACACLPSSEIGLHAFYSRGFHGAWPAGGWRSACSHGAVH